MPAPAPPAMAMASAREIMVSARKVVEEQLGDLKLYRVPEPTTVASRQSTQVRLLDRAGVPVERIYTAEIGPHGPTGYHPPGVDRKSVVEGQSVSVSVTRGVSRTLNKKKANKIRA